MQPSGILGSIGAPSTMFRGVPRPTQSFVSGTVMDILSDLGMSAEEVMEVLPGGVDVPQAPVSAAGPTAYTPIVRDPDSTMSATPPQGVI